MKPKADYLFEVAWEVCNKVGGIYTVVRSKVPHMIEQYKNNYFVIGPYFARSSMREFAPEVPNSRLKRVFERLKQENITAYYGKWLIEGKPNTILVDFSKFFDKKNEIKKQMWDDYKIDSLNSPPDYDGPVVWATAAGKLLEQLSRELKGKKVAHFHEWLSGAALLYLKKNSAKVATVFTTHATTMGRTLAASNFDLYAMKGNARILESLDIEKEAYNWGVPAKHQLEKATAQNADVFTTVSEVTALEAQYVLKRKVDLIVPNALDFSRLPNLEEIPIKHKMHKSKIKEFIITYFSPYYPIDMGDTLFYFISGRYEFKNKGIDVTIKSLNILNERLKKERAGRTIIVFFFIPANIKSINLNVVESKALFEDIRESVEDSLTDMQERVIDGLALQKMPNDIDIFDEGFLSEIRDKMMSFKKEGDPPISTHELFNDQDDQIMRSLRELKLLNKKSDKVKVVLYPSYLSPSDRLLDMDYNSVIWGCHLGIFPSYYEPWGYTPLECAAYGVPSITTDLAGFGRFLLKTAKKEPGIFVIKREGKADDDVVNQLAERLYWYAKLPKEERIRNKIKAENFARLCSWNKLILNYTKAHDMAVEKIRV